MDEKNFTEIILIFLKSNAFSILGSGASILGLLLSIYIFKSIRRIKNYYLFSARVPEQIEKFRECISQLNKYYSDFANSKEEVLLEITRIEAQLEWFKKRVNKSIRKEIKIGLALITKLKNHEINQSKDEVYTAYLRFSKINEILLSLIQDNKWELQ